MPLPNPSKGETQSDFVSRFMSNDQMKKDYPESKQRLAVAYSQWRRRNSKKEATMEAVDLVNQDFEFVIKQVNVEKRLITGEVYAPNVIDTHNELMLPEDVELLAHRFLADKLNDSIDLQHDNEVVQCYAVESFLARDDDPEYDTGTWVLTIKVDEEDSDNIWNRVKSGEFNGFSVDMMVRKVSAIADVEVTPSVVGETEISDGHLHYFYATVDDSGRVTGGVTSEDTDSFGDLHSHKISSGTATENVDGHSHRFFLP